MRRYSDYYLTFFLLLSLQFLFTITGRLIILSRIKRNIRTGKVGFGTLLIGSSQRANEVYEAMRKSEKFFGFHFIGYLELNGKEQNRLTTELNELGKLSDLEKVLDTHPEIEEVIIAIESSEHHRLNDIINRLADKHVTIRIIPDMYDILSGTVRMNHAIGEAFIEIPTVMLNEWERITKRWFDVISSILALLLLSPLLLYIALRIKTVRRRPCVLYTGKAWALWQAPSGMFKFRSMTIHAENNGPQLTK